MKIKTLLILFFLSITVGSCFTKEKANKLKHREDEAYRVCDPIVSAINKYYDKNFVYPDSLEILIDSSLITALPSRAIVDAIFYTRVDSTNFIVWSYNNPIIKNKDFYFQFTLYDPGVNQYSKNSASISWKTSRHY